MQKENRREFLCTCSAAALGIQLASSNRLAADPAQSPVMSIVRYKNPPKEEDGIAEEAERLTRSAIETLGGMSRFVSKGDTVWVKPNICFNRTSEQAANTNPQVVAALVQLCYDAGAKEVHVSNSPSGGQRRAFQLSGIQEPAEKAGARVYHMDGSRFKSMAVNGKFIKEWQIYADVIEADKLINVPVAKSHVFTRVTAGMKNLMGIIGGRRRHFHEDLDNSIPDLAAFVKPDLVVVDGVRTLVRNGPSGGNVNDVVRKDTVAAGVDQVALDAFAATLIGLNPAEVGHIVEAQSRKMGTMDYESLSPKKTTI